MTDILRCRFYHLCWRVSSPRCCAENHQSCDCGGFGSALLHKKTQQLVKWNCSPGLVVVTRSSQFCGTALGFQCFRSATRQVRAENFYHPLIALFCFAISPIRRQIMINKRKGDEGGLCFSAKYVIGSTLGCACLGERRSCASQRENCKCSFRIRQPSKALPK